MSAQTIKKEIPRSTITMTWRWLLPDLVFRIFPMALLPLVVCWVFGYPLSSIGLIWRDIPQQILIGLAIGIPLVIFTVIYRILIVSRRFRRPTLPDHLLQSVFYLLINGPVEELFFRGFLLEMLGRWTGWLGWGIIVSYFSYTLYHRLGKWNWRSVGGVGLVGLVFTILYLWQPEPRSLLAVSIVHGFATAGFLSWSDEALYQIWKRQQKRLAPASQE